MVVIDDLARAPARRGTEEWRSKISLAKGTKYPFTDDELLRIYYNREFATVPETTLYYLLRKRGLKLRRPWGRRIARLMSETEKAWLACALDSEGYISPTTSRRHRIGISNTNKAYIENVARITGVDNIKIDDRTRRHPNHLPMFHWTLQEKKALTFLLEQILSFLIIKREKAEEAIRFATN